ncbi:MAG: cyclase family protein [Candidatus Hydrogenedentes bacterium]|nr:cyclase family protein [Candidatus Hydrogenedentota bacterium]
MRWIDVSIPLRQGVTGWPGDTRFSMTPEQRIAQGDSCNVSRLELSTHTGTHVDAPWHFIDSGKRLDKVPPDIFFGRARVIDVGQAEMITSDILGEEPLPPRVLFRTTNSGISMTDVFNERYVAIEADAARRLVTDGVKLVGVDYLSVAPKYDTKTTHHILLGAEVFIVEGLRLREIPAGDYEFIVLPLPLAGADGSPCRAFIGMDGES